MEKASVAFCPGHISGYFYPVYGPDPMTTGSLGAGIVISEGVTSSVVPSRHSRVEIFRENFRGEIIDHVRGSPPVEYVMEQLRVTAEVTTKCQLPLSAGFGLSAAALLSTIKALNRSFSLGMTSVECAGYAHEAEILSKTGLGDVAGCQGGGIDCRKGAGIFARIERLPPPPFPVYAVTFGPLPSPGILGSRTAMERVKQAFPGTCPKSVEEFFILSRKFAEESDLITSDVRSGLDSCDKNGVPASMTMLGNGIFAYGEKAKKMLSGFGEVFELTVVPPEEPA
jgi:pantoate kinase